MTLPHLAPGFVPFGSFRTLTEARKVATPTALTQHVEPGWLEVAHGIELAKWVANLEAICPAVASFYHVPNEAKRSPILGATLKAQGLKPGVPDYCLPVPIGSAHNPAFTWPGLYIELKTFKGAPTLTQLAYLRRLRAAGYAVALSAGWRAAALTICDYLEGDFNEDRCPIA